MNKSIDKNFYKQLAVIALPIMLQNLINSLINFLDTIMVGSLGEVPIASVGLGNQVFFLLNMILFGITSGGGIFVSQYWGKKDVQKIRSAMGIMLVSSMFVAVIFFVASQIIPEVLLAFYSEDPAVIALGAGYLKIASWSYPLFAITMTFSLSLRNTEAPKIPMIASAISLCVNAILNYLFIFGVSFNIQGNLIQLLPAMGINGTAIATVISRIIELAILLTVGYKKKLPPAGHLSDFRFTAAFFGKFLKFGLPVIFNETFWSFGVTLQNRVYARAGTDVITAFNITNTISQLAWVFLLGIGSGAGVLVGKKIGEGDKEMAFNYAKRIGILAPCVAAVVAPILIPISSTLHLFFNVSPEILAQTKKMLLILVFLYPCKAFNMTMIAGVCRSGGDTVYSALADTMFMYLITLPLASYVAFTLGVPAFVIFLCLNSEDVLKFIAMLLRLVSKKWLHDVTVEKKQSD